MYVLVHLKLIMIIIVIMIIIIISQTKIRLNGIHKVNI